MSLLELLAELALDETCDSEGDFIEQYSVTYRRTVKRSAGILSKPYRLLLFYESLNKTFS
jgi:hypothetical protein